MSLKKPMTKMLVYVGILFTLIFGWYGVKKIMFMWFFAHYKPPVATITATIAKSETWQSYLSAVGTLKAQKGVDISAEIPGVIEEIRFNSGQFVKKGEPLVLLRSDVEKALLKSNKAKLQLAQISYDRAKALFTKHAFSQAQLDTHYAELMEAEGSVESTLAQIKQKTITAPFDGKLGIRQVNLGQYVAPNTSMVTLQALKVLYVMFDLPEKYVANLSLGQEVAVSVDSNALPHEGAGFNHNEIKTTRGKIVAINAKVDPSTRNILVQATIPNDHYDLYPGMFVMVKVLLPAMQNTIVVPQTAISYSLSGDYIFLIKQDVKESLASKNKNKQPTPVLRAYRQYVKVGERRGEGVAILEGLKAGDQIVTSGQIKLQNRSEVAVDNSVNL